MAVKTPLKTLVDNPIERLTSGARSAVDLGSRELSQDWGLALSQMLGLDGTRKMTKNDILQPVNEGPVTEGELHEGVEVSFAKSEKSHADIEAAIDYAGEIRHAETIVRSKEEGERGSRIEQVRARIMQEGSDTQAVTQIRVETKTQRGGVYEETYNEDLLRTIRLKTDNPSDMVQKKAAKRDFHSLTQVHGTKFSLSSERAVAQQVG